MRIPLLILVLFNVSPQRANADVVFTRERCDRSLFGLQPLRGEPSRYRQCGPNGRVWIVPCMPGALFDPMAKVCKEMPAQLSPPFQQKLIDTRRRTQEEAIPITEEFIFSTRKPKRPRPKTKGRLMTTTTMPVTHTTTAFPAPSSLFTPGAPTVLSSMTTIAPSPTPPPRTIASRPYSPVFTPPNRKIATFATAPLIHPTLWPSTEVTLGQHALGQQTQYAYPDTMGPIGISETHMTRAYPASYVTSNQGQTHPAFTPVSTATVEQAGHHPENEQYFLNELLRLVKAHQVAIDGIKEENEASRTPVEMLRANRPEGRSNFGEDQTASLKHTNELQKRIEFDKMRLEKQRQNEVFQQIVDRQEEERAKQHEIARQTEERLRKDRQEWERLQEKIRQNEEMQKREMEELERQRLIAQQLEEMEKNERKEKQRQKELARQIEENERKEKQRQKELARQIEADRKKEMEQRRQQESARQMEEKQKKEKEEQERQQRIAWEIEEKQKKEREELERQQRIAWEIEEKQKKEREELERQQRIAWEIEERQKKERAEQERQQRIAWEIEERQKKERAEQERQQKVYLQIEEKKKKDKEERDKKLKLAQQIEERQKMEKEERQRKQKVAQEIVERQKKEREEHERQQQIARQNEERQKKEREEREKQREREFEEQKRLRNLEEQRLEAERMKHEEEWRKMEEQTRIEDRYGMVDAVPQTAGERGAASNVGIADYSRNTDYPNVNVPGRMSSHNEVESAIESNNIVYFTKTPSTTQAAIVEWVTSPHSWRPPPDPNLNQPKWIETTTTESPSRVISGCALSEDCPFNYEQDLLCAHPSNPSRYLQCTPMIGRRGRWMERNCPPSLIFIQSYAACGTDVIDVSTSPYEWRNTALIPRLPSEPEVVRWQGNRELPAPAVELPPSSVFTTPPPSTIYQTIESFPQDLNPFNRNTIHPAYYGTEDVEIAPSVIDPPFPRVEPYFGSPFGKQRDDSVEGDFIGGFIKPVIKKIAMDQAETFLDQILSDEAIKDDNANTPRHPPTLPEDGWKVKSG